MSLEYRIERDRDTITVVPEGDISLETVDVLRQVLRTVVETPGVRRIVIDMQAVTFLDSSGIGVLVAAQRAAATHDRGLLLSRPGPVVRMVLEVTNLEDLLVR